MCLPRPGAMRFLLLGVVLAGCGTSAAYWDVPRAGTNFFHQTHRAERHHQARALGITLVRLAPNKWASEQRDFLVGDADRFEGLVPDDLVRVRAALDEAAAADQRVVLTTLSLPGARWRQHNEQQTDSRLFEHDRYLEQAARFWGELARALRGHPALVGYNLINEPRASSADLARVYRRLLRAVRQADPDAWVIVDVGDDADPSGFEGFVPLDDERVLYAFHFYQPWSNTTWRRNQGRVSYPSPGWNRDTLRAALAPVDEWRRAHGVSPRRIFVEEVGCDRRIPGVERYLADAIDLFEQRGFHWAFYSFREDDWDGMDYERRPEAFQIVRRGIEHAARR